ncbi:MAG: SusC/RagA family TonB-linked outer membrane protein [Prolixibacteraceae bacterium]
MMQKFTTLLVSMLIVGFSMAQERNIKGIVRTADGSSLPGATITIEGSTIGTISDDMGNYILKVPDNNAVLLFSFVGMKTQKIIVGNKKEIDVSLSESSIEMNELVVTAMGITREKKGLTYSVESISAENMTKVGESNFVNNLAGKVAGVQVSQTSGSIGSSSRIIMRGWSSATGGNQPLFVVDGVPIDNSNYSNDAMGYSRSAIDYGNAAMDINPNDIAEISVLKGGTAAALYGSRAANGAIVITTKSGEKTGKAFGVSYNTSASFANPLRLPDYQNTYSQGYFNMGLGDILDNYGFAPDESWGAKMDGHLELHPVTGEMVPLNPIPDNRKDFYDTGLTFNNNISVSGNSDKFSYRFSWTNTDQKGIMPTSKFEKNHFSLNASYQPNEKLKISSTANFIKSKAHNRDAQGQYDGGVNIAFLWGARNFNWREMKDLRDENGDLMNYYGSYWWENPWFILENCPNDDQRTRFFGNTEVEYELLKGLKIHGRVGIDTYFDERHERFAFGGISTGRDNGGFVDYYVNVAQVNADYYLSWSKDINEHLDISAILGHNINQRAFSDLRLEAYALIAPGTFGLNNVAGDLESQNYSSLRRLHGVYSSVNFGFNDYLFLDLTARNDWSSTLPTDANSYFYPSAGLGFIFSKALNIENNVFNHGKLRLNWAQVGNDAPPYRLYNTYRRTDIHDGLSDNFKFPMGNVFGFSVSDIRNNSTLKPEIQSNFEVGAEVELFKNKVRLDLTYYKQNTRDQIIRHGVSASTGYTSNYINAGEIENKGIEAMLRLTPVKTSNFRWDIDINYTRNRNMVLSLIEGVDAITIPGGFTSPSVQVRVGEPYGVMYGTYYKRDDDGNFIVNPEDGLPIIVNEPKKIGDPNPDWMGGIKNSLSYKGLSLSFMFDTKQGGDLSSTSIAILRQSGQVVETETMYGYTREDEFVIPGSKIELEDGTLIDNTTATTINDYHWHGLFAVDDEFVFDASYIKLREVTISYALPKSLLNKIKFIQNANVYASGRNLLLFGTNIPHIDPELDAGATTGNLHGYEYANSPTTRNITFGLNISF